MWPKISVIVPVRPGAPVRAMTALRHVEYAPKQLEIVEKISRGVRLLDGLVTDVLSFAKPSNPQRQRIVLGCIVDEVIELISPMSM